MRPASTASAHLAKLVEASLLAMERRGRHRYLREAMVSYANPRAVDRVHRRRAR